MFELIKDFIDKKLIVFNSSLSSPLQIKLVYSRVDADYKPTQEKALHYQLDIMRVRRNQDEMGRHYFVDVNLSFFFLAAGKDRGFYQRTFDTYVWELMRVLMTATTTLYMPYKNIVISPDTLNAIEQIALTDTSVFDDNIYKPVIEITFEVMI